MIAVLLADGFEEIEALTPVDMLRRAGLEVLTVGITSKIAVGSHGISVICDKLPEEIDLDMISTVILPGGMPGTKTLDECPVIKEKAVEFANAIIRLLRSEELQKDVCSKMMF